MDDGNENCSMISSEIMWPCNLLDANNKVKNVNTAKHNSKSNPNMLWTNK
jgi:hypothetical protein